MPRRNILENKHYLKTFLLSLNIFTQYFLVTEKTPPALGLSGRAGNFAALKTIGGHLSAGNFTALKTIGEPKALITRGDYITATLPRRAITTCCSH